MDATWWKKAEELDDDQKKLISIPIDGRYLVLGPPGCGKTNILILRATFLEKSGFPNFIVVSFTRTLKEFMASGVEAGGKFPPAKVQTFARWSLNTIRSLGFNMEVNDEDSHDEKREKRANALAAAIDRAKLKSSYYHAILVDEVQDFWRRELQVLARLTGRLFLVGDSRQRIYDANEGIDAARELRCEERGLRYHYRMGKSICRAADNVLPSPDGDTLEKYCQYNEAALPSSVTRHKLPSRVAQYKRLLEKLRTQVRAYPGEWIGVIAPTRKIRNEVMEFLDGSELAAKCKAQLENSADRQFDPERPICILVSKSSKGLEFRCVHFMAADEIPYYTRELAFTVITRAKTALDVYHTSTLEGSLEAAFSEKSVPAIKDLF